MGLFELGPLQTSNHFTKADANFREIERRGTTDRNFTGTAESIEDSKRQLRGGQLRESRQADGDGESPPDLQEGNRAHLKD